MARTRRTAKPQPEEATAPQSAPSPPAERRFGVGEYTRGMRNRMHAAILNALHPSTKATQSEWDDLLALALRRPVP